MNHCSSIGILYIIHYLFILLFIWGLKFFFALLWEWMRVTAVLCCTRPQRASLPWAKKRQGAVELGACSCCNNRPNCTFSFVGLKLVAEHSYNAQTVSKKKKNGGGRKKEWEREREREGERLMGVNCSPVRSITTTHSSLSTPALALTKVNTDNKV